jgi:hypothetical protein
MMAIIMPGRESKVETIASGAPDARPVAKPRGRKKPFAMTLPPDLIEAVDGIAAEQERSRAKMVEMALRQFVDSYRANREAA